MRNKQVIEQLCSRAKQIADQLYRDVDSGKPHLTSDYVTNQLASLVSFLEQQQQYLDLED